MAHHEYSLMRMKNPRWTRMVVAVVVSAVFQQGVGETWAPQAVSGLLPDQPMPPSL